MSETLGSTNANIFLQSREIGGIQFSSECALKVEYENGMKEGIGWVFSEKKTKLARLSFHEDQLDGLCIFYTYDGQKKNEYMYENGIQRGWGREYLGGRAAFTGIYENGKRKSELLEYDDDKEQYKEVMNDQVISICRFNENHKLNGICYFYENNCCFDVILYEDGIKKLNDSLNVLNSNLQMCQSKLATLQQKQNELESDKVGVKNLFVYLAIFSVVAIFLVVLLSKKIAGKGNLTEKQVKDIITDFASRHPEIINGSTQLTLSQYLGYIQTNEKNIDSINLRLNALTNWANGQVGGNAPTGQQSWEKQSTLKVQQKEAENQSAGASRVFYMKRPLKDMEFELSLKRERPTEETMYRFEIDSKRPNLAHFVFNCDSPNRVRWALNTKDKTLDRVCNASGSGTNGKYQCTAEGEAELRDGKWVVTRKAVVIFD